MKKFFSLIAVALVAFAAQATEWTAADGNENVEYAPVYGYNFETDQHNQMQYPAAELTGLAAGTEITALKFYTSTISLVNELGGTVVVSLANIDDVTPWSPDAWGGISGDLLDVAVTAVATVTPAADEDGVWTITFNAPFTYTGNALLIDVQSVAGDYQSTAFYGKEMGSYLIMSTYGYAGSTKGDTKLPKATFVYDGGQGGETTEVALLSEANALEDNVEFTFNGNAVVTLQHGDFLFVRDESGFGQIRGAIDGTFEGGQVLSQGWNATKAGNDGWVWYTDAAGLIASSETNAELAAPIVLTGAVDDSMLNAYVCIENQQPTGGFIPLPARFYTLPDGTTIARGEILWGVDAGASRVPYNVYGIIVKGSDGSLMLNPVDFAPYVEPQPEFIRGDVNKDGKVNISDVTALINLLLTNNTDITEHPEGDMNESGDLTISDVTALVNYLLTNGGGN